ncbi:MAG: hypothetical protein ABJA79_01180 [Parafilimonas sp.]
MKEGFFKATFFYLIFILLSGTIKAQRFTNHRASTGVQRRAAFQKQIALLDSSPYKNLQWRLMGPDTRSGRCTDVCGIAGNKNFIIAAFATGGIWKTEDAGTTWQSLFDTQGTQSVGSIAIAPSDTNIIYAGTGESNIFRASLPGMGIYKSTDKGKTWKQIGLENTGTIARIIVNPQNPDVVYVAASGNEWSYNKERGVYLTINGGKTWKKILNENEKSGCIDLQMHPSNPNILYASMWNRIRKRWSDPVPQDSDYIYKTTDGGAHWKMIDKGLPDTKYTGRIGLAISKNNPDVLYAFVDNHNKKRDPEPGEKDSYERLAKKILIGADIYRSNDGGETWTEQGQIHDFVKPFSGTYGWVFGQIRINPVNDSIVYALGVQMVRSSDAGKTWKKFEPVDTTGDWIHGDNHGMWIDPEDSAHIIVGDDGGVCTTYDGGYRWDNFYAQIPTTQFYTVTYDMQTPFNVYGAVQDEGTMYGSVTNTFGQKQDLTVKAWDYAAGGEGTQVRVHPDSPNIIYSSSYYGRLMRSDMNLPDSVRSTHIEPQKENDTSELRGEWLAATIISKYNHNTIYHGMQYVFKSENGGETWKRISNDLSYNDKKKMGDYPYLIYHHAITGISESSLKKGLLYAGTDDGRVWLTKDDGQSWKEISKGIIYNAHVSSIVSSKFEEARVYLTLSDRREDNITPYIYRSDNYGTTWKSIAANLPPSPVNVMIEDEDDANKLFCGTDMGIYMSTDGGKSWIALNANMPPSVSVNDMFIHPRDKKLVVGTYGRGVYVLDDMSVLEE